MVVSRVDESTQIDSKNDRWVDTDRDRKIFWKISDFKKFSTFETFFYFVSNKSKLVVFLFFFQQKFYTCFWGLIRCWIRIIVLKFYVPLGFSGSKSSFFESIRVDSSILVTTIRSAVKFYTDMVIFEVSEFSISTCEKCWYKFGVGL